MFSTAKRVVMLMKLRSNLMTLTRRDDVNGIQALMANHPDLSFGFENISYAIEVDAPNTVAYMLEVTGRREVPKLLGIPKWSRLAQAAYHNSPKVIHLLLSQGENADEEDDYGKCPIHWAAEKGHLRCVQELLPAMKQPLKRNANGINVMDIAERSNNYELAQLVESLLPNR